MTIKHLFLDLEDTIITPVLNGWFQTELINVQKINEFIDTFKPDHVHLFSFAIWNETERQGFERGARSMIENALNRKLECIPTVDDHIIPACCNVLRISREKVDFSECSAFWGKQGAFKLFCQDKFGARLWRSDLDSIEVVLLDDMVFNEDFDWPDSRIKGHVINIDKQIRDL